MAILTDVSPDAKLTDLTLVRGLAHATDEESKMLMMKLLVRLNSVRFEQESFRQWCERADKLYFAETLNKNSGADLWPEHESATTNGRQHVSINLPSVYVDIPSALQAVEPIENILATDTTDEAVAAAAALERIYYAWKQAEDFELKFHKAIVTKSLYGRTAARVYWDAETKKPCVEVIQQPRHLFLGYKTDSYEELEWAAYRMYYDPNALAEQFGVDGIAVGAYQNADGSVMPMVQQASWDDIPSRVWDSTGLQARIEVYDFWYRQPVWKGSKFVRMDTYNTVIAGNVVIRKPTKYDEYKGKLPYIPLLNTFVPGMPNGRPDLYDVEPLIREKMERITSGAQLIANVTRGDSYQLTGPDAPTRIPPGLLAKPGAIAAPGPGNRIEVITPFVAQFQLEQFLGRIDREMAAISGLNDLLLGLAPAQVLSSSKAINALIANYESRLSLRRKLLYKWRRNVWELAQDIYAQKDSVVKLVVSHGGGFLDITDPSLSPRDDMETATRAVNLMNAKAWSLARTMDTVGVDDPETEMDLIRKERTDATLFPADVQVMAQLMGALQALGLSAPQGAMGQVQQQLGSGQNALQQAGATATPDNATSSQLPGDQAVPPAAGPLAAPPAGDNAPVLQGMVQNGEAKGRIMTQAKLGRR